MSVFKHYHTNSHSSYVSGPAKCVSKLYMYFYFRKVQSRLKMTVIHILLGNSYSTKNNFVIVPIIIIIIINLFKVDNRTKIE